MITGIRSPSCSATPKSATQNLLRAALAASAGRCCLLAARRLLRSSPPPSLLLATVLRGTLKLGMAGQGYAAL